VAPSDVLMRRRPTVLAVDVGGTHVKVLPTGRRTPRKISSGPRMTARAMVTAVKRLVADWRYDVVSMGYPGVCVHGRPVAEPHNLGPGWVGFDFEGAFGCPVRIVEPMELAHLPYKKGRTYEDYVGRRGIERLGTKRWRRHVADVTERLRAALEAEDVVIGGGNAKRLERLPEGTRLGTNGDAFTGGFRLWDGRWGAAGGSGDATEAHGR
jgi:polyphosphate glucokinase